VLSVYFKKNTQAALFLVFDTECINVLDYNKYEQLSMMDKKMSLMIKC